MTYAETIEYLYSLRWFGTKLGLENTLQLTRLAGDPQQRLRFIHVAGTNGKGSTCAILESIYRAAGLRVGLFTSPHLVSFCERIQVNRQPMTEAEVVLGVRDLRILLEAFSPETHPTFFEVVTVLALRHFAERGCDLVIWETGLGGRLDATSIVHPVASIITNVTLEHQQWLGNTVQEIAFEKAGIIKPGVPVFTAAAPDALAVIRDVAAQHQAPLTVLGPDAISTLLDSMSLGLLGDHQRLNAGLALAAVDHLQPSIPVSDATLVQGLSTVQWQGRFQVEKIGSQTFLLDGAHNPAGVEALCSGLQKNFPDCRPTLIFGVMADKDWRTMCGMLAPVAGRLLLTPVRSERSLPPEQMTAVCQQSNPQLPVCCCGSLVEALGLSADAPCVVICGSLYLVGEALELLGLSAVPAEHEHRLNHWGAPGQRPALALVRDQI